MTSDVSARVSLWLPQPLRLIIVVLAVAGLVPGVDAASVEARLRRDDSSRVVALPSPASTILGQPPAPEESPQGRLRGLIGALQGRRASAAQIQNLQTASQQELASESQNIAPEVVSKVQPVDGEALTAWVHRVVFWVTLGMVVFVTASSYSVLLYRKYHPVAGQAVAYMTKDEDSPKDALASDSGEDSEKKVTPRGHGLSKRSSVREGGNIYLTTGHITLSTDDIIGKVGITGMAILNPDAASGITKMRYRYSVPIIGTQAVILQLGLLFFLATQLIPRTETKRHFEDLPISILVIAVYLHFLNCAQELPYSWQLFQHLQDFHKDMSNLLLMGSVVILENFVVSLVSFVLGALYLCTSRTIGDVILNSVAVAFVNEIDNWILDLNSRANFLAGKVSSAGIVHLPINQATMSKVAWGVIFVPVVPVAVSAGLCYVGVEVLML